MIDVFLSYKHEDKVRVARLAKALEGSGFSVWWDPDLPGGELWRNNIEAAHAAARCIVVIWTRLSVTSPFVRDEAVRALEAHKLVPVLFDKIRPPIGFGEIQTTDLIHWRGNLKNPFFLDLKAAIRAKISGVAAPKPKGPIARLTQQLLIGTVSTTTLGSLAAFALNIPSVSSQVCHAPPQPGLSDLCGAMGIAGFADKDDRLAWEAARQAKTCKAYRDYVNRAGRAVYRAEASQRLQGRITRTVDVWSREQRPLPLVLSAAADPRASEVKARADADQRARTLAEDMCRGFAATTLYRFEAASYTVRPNSWRCENDGAGYVCTFSADAVCTLQVNRPTEIETCPDKR